MPDQSIIFVSSLLKQGDGHYLILVASIILAIVGMAFIMESYLLLRINGAGRLWRTFRVLGPLSLALSLILMVAKLFIYYNSFIHVKDVVFVASMVMFVAGAILSQAGYLYQRELVTESGRKICRLAGPIFVALSFIMFSLLIIMT